MIQGNRTSKVLAMNGTQVNQWDVPARAGDEQIFTDRVLGVLVGAMPLVVEAALCRYPEFPLWFFLTAMSICLAYPMVLICNMGQVVIDGLKAGCPQLYSNHGRLRERHPRPHHQLLDLCIVGKLFIVFGYWDRHRNMLNNRFQAQTLPAP